MDRDLATGFFNTLGRYRNRRAGGCAAAHSLSQHPSTHRRTATMIL
jgi:hypothetical protein